jgi:hypothetical protein
MLLIVATGNCATDPLYLRQNFATEPIRPLLNQSKISQLTLSRKKRHIASLPPSQTDIANQYKFLHGFCFDALRIMVIGGSMHEPRKAGVGGRGTVKLPLAE